MTNFFFEKYTWFKKIHSSHNSILTSPHLIIYSPSYFIYFVRIVLNYFLQSPILSCLEQNRMIILLFKCCSDERSTPYYLHLFSLNFVPICSAKIIVVQEYIFSLTNKEAHIFIFRQIKNKFEKLNTLKFCEQV